MTTFNNKSLLITSIWSTYTPKLSVLCYVKANICLNSTSTHNDTTSENISSAIYEAHLPLIDNEW